VEEPDEFCPHHGRSHKELVAEVERERRRSARLEDESNEARRLCIVAERERDRLRTVLDAGERNVDAVAAGLPGTVLASKRLATWAVIAALRGRAGMEPTS
jgi:hypothetical protein